jgi:hypothetical protein
MPSALRVRPQVTPSRNIARETLRRLDQEQREFQEFIRRLRMARGKVEFDQFITEQRAASKD